MITGNHITATDIDDLNRYSYNMGAKIYLSNESNILTNLSTEVVKSNYLIKIPKKTADGYLTFDIGKISFDEDTIYGYLPYTIENIILQAFKCLGDDYDWGNKYNSRDCSGFVASIYNTMGFVLPRDTAPIEKIPATSSIFTKDVKNELKSLLPGSLIFKNGHVMLSLGTYNDIPYIIHAFSNGGSSKLLYTTAITTAYVYDVNILTSALTFK